MELRTFIAWQTKSLGEYISSTVLIVLRKLAKLYN